jgi:hypothetical protein
VGKNKKENQPNLANKNFNYLNGVIDYDYETYYPCQNGSDCCENDYCRCGQILNAEVTKLQKTDIFVSESWSALNEIDLYCIERILTINKFWNTDSWEITVCSGYYGEEIDKFIFNHANNCKGLIDVLLSLETNASKIEFVLNLEYGYILDAAKNLEWEMIEIPRNKIIFGQKDHYKKLDAEIIAYYQDWSFPRGLVIESSVDQYKIIDGYHRIAASGDNLFVLIGKEKKNAKN